MKIGAARTSTVAFKDQVKTENWYSYPWTHVIRCKNAAGREKIAVAMEHACANNNIGYSKDVVKRVSLYNKVKGKKYDPAKATSKCYCDCSSLASLCCMYAGYKIGNSTSQTIRGKLVATGKFKVFTSSAYTKKTNKLARGDILLAEGHHVAVVLSKGADGPSNIVTTTSVTTTVSSSDAYNTSFVCGINKKKLPITKGLQKTFLVDSKNLYVTQMLDGITLYISHCKITNGVANCDSYMVIKNSGHSELLVSYNWKGKKYLLIDAGEYVQSNTTSYKWACSLARVEFQNGVTLDASNLTRVKQLSTYRLEGNVNQDGVLILYNKSSGGTTEINLYNMSYVNQLFDKHEGGTISPSSFEAIRGDSVSVKTSEAELIKPQDSLQGIAMGVSKNYFYTIGGSAGKTPLVYKVYYREELDHDSQFYLTNEDFGPYIECEGLQIKDSTVYFAVNNKGATYPRAVYSIPLSKILGDY